ncbi:hypothetical protein IWZ01DRAFT_49126 [Phyllosticta capitalensis]
MYMYLVVLILFCAVLRRPPTRVGPRPSSGRQANECSEPVTVLLQTPPLGRSFPRRQTLDADAHCPPASQPALPSISISLTLHLLPLLSHNTTTTTTPTHQSSPHHIHTRHSSTTRSSFPSTLRLPSPLVPLWLDSPSSLPSPYTTPSTRTGLLSNWRPISPAVPRFPPSMRQAPSGTLPRP